MKKLLLIFIIFTTFLNAQSGISEQKNDSLLLKWQNKNLPDTVRFESLSKFINNVWLYNDPDSTKHYSDLLFNAAEKAGNRNYQAQALLLEGSSRVVWSDDELGLVPLRKAMQIALEDSIYAVGSRISNSLGVALQNLGKWDEAIIAYEQGVEFGIKSKDKRVVGSALINIGAIRSDQGNDKEAIQLYQRGYKLFEEAGFQKGKVRVLLNIGIVYESQNEFDRARDYYRRSLKVAEEIADQKGISGALTNIGSAFKLETEYDSAMFYLNKGLKFSEEVNDEFWVATTLRTIGEVQSANKDFKGAIDNFSKSLKLFQSMGDQPGEASLNVFLSEAYREIGDNSKALEFSIRAFNIAAEVGAAYEQRDALLTQFRVYQKLGNSEKALDKYLKYIELRDSLLSESNQREVIRQEYKTDYEKQAVIDSLEFETERAIQTTELEREKAMKNSLFAGFVLVAIFAGVFFTQRNRITKEKEKNEVLLLNILPAEVAEELKIKGSAEAVNIDQVSVLFTDFKGFTAMAEKLSPKQLVEDLNRCFSEFDYICERYGIEKIKTIGDAYMAAGGLPSPDVNHAQNVVSAALDMVQIVENEKASKLAKGLPYFEIRIGIHTGPVVAGIVGVKKFQYDIWGDTVNTASRMESSGEIGKVNISDTTYNCVKDLEAFKFEYRGMIEAKGKGELKMYFASKA